MHGHKVSTAVNGISYLEDRGAPIRFLYKARANPLPATGGFALLAVRQVLLCDTSARERIDSSSDSNPEGISLPPGYLS